MTRNQHLDQPDASCRRLHDDLITTDLREQSRRYGLRDGGCLAVAQGSGEQYLSAFALLLHAGPVQLGILSALPQLIGTIAQLASVKLLRLFSGRKSMIVAGTIGQALSWIPIIVLPLLLPQWGPWLVIAGAALYFACNHFTAPHWTSFIADHLDEHERGGYFAQRAFIIAAVSFIALGLSGAALTFWQQHAPAWVGFALIFSLAGMARLCSAMALRPVEDVHPRATAAGRGLFRTFYARSSKSFRHFLLFSSLMHMAVLIAGPFFVLYMIRDLHLSYFWYGTWLAAGVLGQLMTLGTWGRFSDRFGNKALLAVTGYTVPVLPMLYLLSTNLAFMMAVNFFGGVVWAGLSLGLQNYVLDAVTPQERAKAVALSNTVNAVGWCGGALLGGWLVDALPATIDLARLPIPLGSHLPLIFFASGLLRLMVAGALLGRFHEARAVVRIPVSELLLELPLLKTLAQIVGSPLSRMLK
ncbi:MAG TPA: MFS transporter [Nitrospira sp.]|nr:MFS transporter [Nitrospira sp.]